MKTRPILFSGPMVRAILDGSKTQTRRIVKPSRGVEILGDDSCGVLWDQCPYGQPGDQLWVRETWMDLREVEGAVSDAMYRATFGNTPQNRKWSPSIHMPRWASRITLEITGIRVERLQDISEKDAWAEGVAMSGVCYGKTILPSTATGIERYRALWESINGPGSWEANPWVWTVEFRRVKP